MLIVNIIYTAFMVWLICVLFVLLSAGILVDQGKNMKIINLS